MKTLIRVLSVLCCVAPFGVADAVVPSTVGDNLTAYNSNSGSAEGNRWNTLMNSRSGGTTTSSTNATADFGNCNAVVLRCAQPKCNNGGCTDTGVATAIVNGCIQSNPTCKQYGDDLVSYISAQLVASSAAKQAAATNAANAAASSAASQQSAQQIAALQQQIQQMQSTITSQNTALQNAMAEQQKATAEAIADATKQSAQTQSSSTVNVSDAQRAAVANGLDPDLVVREQISGQILSAIENAETSMKELSNVMQDAFRYAGCDERGNNCRGPKRVKMFKQKAGEFFGPYEQVIDEMYEALLLAQSVGVDISDIYMMLSNSCNVWGQFYCEGIRSIKNTVNNNSGNSSVIEYQPLRYTAYTCIKGESTQGKDPNDPNGVISHYIIGGQPCKVGGIIPVSDGGCQPLGPYTGDKEVKIAWLNEEETENGKFMIGCLSEVLDNSSFFTNRKKQASIDIETLQRIVSQDALDTSYNRKNLVNENLKYCAVDENEYIDLQKLVSTKSLPTKNICISQNTLDRFNKDYLYDNPTIMQMSEDACRNRKDYSGSGCTWYSDIPACFCATSTHNTAAHQYDVAKKDKAERNCNNAGCEWTDNANDPTTKGTCSNITGVTPTSTNCASYTIN